MPYKEFCIFFWGKLFYKSNGKLLTCVCIAWYKHSRYWENSWQLCKPSTSSRVCITVSNSPNPSLVYIRLCKHGKRFLLLKYKRVKGMDLRVKPPCVKLCWVPSPPPPLWAHLTCNVPSNGFKPLSGRGRGWPSREVWWRCASEAFSLWNCFHFIIISILKRVSFWTRNLEGGWTLAVCGLH